MYINYNKGFYRIQLDHMEQTIYKNKEFLLCKSFLTGYELHTDGYFYPRIVLNKTLTRVFKNDNYKEYSQNNIDLIATHTAYTMNDILIKNNWFINVVGKIEPIPTDISIYYVYLQNNHYLGIYGNDTSASFTYVLPIMNTQLSLVGDKLPIATLDKFFSFIINSNVGLTPLITFLGNYDNGTVLTDE